VLSLCKQFVVSRDSCLRLDNDKYQSEALKLPDFPEAISCLQKKMSDMPHGEF